MTSTMIYNVSFPKLGISLKINPILFSFSNITVRWYGVIIALGFLLAFLYIMKRSNDFGFKNEQIENIIFITSISAILSARLYYVIFYPGDFYIKNPSKILCINEGGIAIYGAILGGLLALYFMSKRAKMNFLSLLDLMSLGVVIGQTIGRWGNFVNQEAFGTVTNLPWGMSSENTLNQTVHPCFLYESLGCLLCFIFLHYYSLRQKHSKGNIFLMYMIIYGIIRFFIEGLRTDSLIIPRTSIRISQVVSMLIIIISILSIHIKNRKKHI